MLLNVVLNRLQIQLVVIISIGANTTSSTTAFTPNKSSSQYWPYVLTLEKTWYIKYTTRLRQKVNYLFCFPTMLDLKRD